VLMGLLPRRALYATPSLVKGNYSEMKILIFGKEWGEVGFRREASRLYERLRMIMFLLDARHRVSTKG